MLEKCHSYKDKIAQGLRPSAGLFSYPILMAADILIVLADRVPVGKDQKQHLEVTRDLAGFFNNRYGEVFKLPEADICDAVATLPGTDGQKMSKSYNNTIEIFGAEKPTRKKIMSIVTDSQPVEAPKQNLDENVPLQLYRAVAGPGEAAAMEQRLAAGGYGYGELKKDLYQAIMDHFAPFRERRAALEKDAGYVNQVLADGAARANLVANETMAKVRQAVGLTE